MIEVSFISSFRRIFKNKTKVDKELYLKFWEKVELFINDPFETSLKTHKLSGKLKDLWSFSLGYDERVTKYIKYYSPQLITYFIQSFSTNLSRYN